MTVKHPIIKNRIRKIPGQFSWVDHRLVRDRYIEKVSHQAAALYLFLVTVGDANGLNYYGDKSIMKRLSMDQSMLQNARSSLIQNGMIAWQEPFYQVLSLEFIDRSERTSMGQFLSMGSILKKAGTVKSFMKKKRIFMKNKNCEIPSWLELELRMGSAQSS